MNERYGIFKIIGKGEFGEVYLAHDFTKNVKKLIYLEKNIKYK